MTTVSRVLILLSTSNNLEGRLAQGLMAAFPDLRVDQVHHHSEVGPYIAETDVLMTFGTLMTDDVLKAATRLQWIHILGSGVDGIFDRPSLRRDVLVTSSRGGPSTAVSETALALMFALARNIPQLVRNQAQQRWDRPAPSLLHGKTVAIVGVGAIAEVLALKCQALGMTVTGISATPRTVPGFHSIYKRADLAVAARAADILVNLAPATPETRGLVNAAVLAVMKPTSYVINVGRGGVIDETALVAALKGKTLSGAGLDVFETEPLPPDHPLWSLPNVIVSPHLGGLHAGLADDLLPIITQNMRLFRAGNRDHMLNIIQAPRGQTPGIAQGTAR